MVSISLLAAMLSTAELLPPVLAWTWAWRIEREYPEHLRAAANDWAEHREIQNARIAAAIRSIQVATGCSIIAALELLAIEEKSEPEAQMLLARSTHRDNLGMEKNN